MRKLLAAVALVAAVFPGITRAADFDPFNIPDAKLVMLTEQPDPNNTAKKWRELRERIEEDLKVVRSCDPCSEEVLEFRALVAVAKAESGKRRFGLVNKAIDQEIVPTSDIVQYGTEDNWASPLLTLKSKRGDCDKYATLKYAVFGEAGVPEKDRQLLIVEYKGEDHMVLVVRLNDDWLVLDNRTLILADFREMVKYYHPRFLLDQSGAQMYERITATN